ncbi:MULTISPECIES: TetR/AcrR family transcriptional regulator [unclassified Frigoribacterium]|uniref:TetR/AcrR family transcriptional regulator n=1 Tax=unclassified Frigoribacterium TaxID=2627005 RepID=UPI0006F5E458|nr:MULTISPECIES: TetR/AcrR family transcriptional regulator [unclassified Frigoribacterium]KQN39210.1 TetR family transcriptional regulator [Frigoribacterium sp. Leaf44]MBD8540457.1 TetR/AcrR family transcriptional regulator [Frigoribacterium sp. CFBP 8751]
MTTIGSTTSDPGGVPTGAADGSRPARRGPYAKSAERRLAIVEAAFEVFSTKGYVGGSLRDVADVVGMSQTSLLHYFPSKSALLLAVLERRDTVSDRSAEPPDRGDLIGTVLGQARHNETVPGLIALYAVLAGEAVTTGNPGSDYVRERFERLRAEYGDALRALEARGRLRPGVDPDRAASGLVALWDGIQLQWLLDPDRIDVVQQLQDHLDLLVLPDDAVDRT